MKPAVEVTAAAGEEAASGWCEQLVLCAADEVGLKAVIAIDSTVLGPAIGGTRMMRYASDAEAIADAQRLAAAMTLKAALAGLPVGGGKAVVIADPAAEKTEALLRAYGRFVHSLGGRYAAAQDVGTTPHDLDVVAAETPYVVGVSPRLGGAGDPSPYTARGVHCAMRGWSAQARGSADLAGVRVVVSGVGAVGTALVELLLDDGAEVTVADVDAARTERLGERCDVAIVDPRAAHAQPCDIFAPCALGGVIDERTVSELRCRAVIGAANNQLTEPALADDLRTAGIDYVPDFLASAGGLMTGTSELLWRPFSRERALALIDEIEPRTSALLEASARDGESTLTTARRVATERIAAARRLPQLRRVEL